MYQERPVPVQEYIGVEYKSPFERELVRQLKIPTRLAADWYLQMVGNSSEPPIWYKNVLIRKADGSFDWDKLSRDLNTKPNADRLKDPYTVITKKWQARSMLSIPGIRDVVYEISKSFLSTANYIEKECIHEPYREAYEASVIYYREVADFLKEGKFVEDLIASTKLPPELKILGSVQVEERYDDPIGLKDSPYGLIALMNRVRTVSVNSEIVKYKKAAEKIYSQPPQDATVHVANMVMVAGSMAAAKSRPSAFNIPNDPEVVARAGKSVIYIFPNRIAQKNQEQLSKAQQELYGYTTSNEALERFTLFHEYIGHGYKWKNIGPRLISIGQPVLEGIANQRAIVVASSDLFSEECLLDVCNAAVAFASDDLGPELRKAIKEPFGSNQPDLKRILEEGTYTLDAHRFLRGLGSRGLIKPDLGIVNLNGVVELAKEMDELYTKIADAKTEESGKAMLAESLKEQRGFSVTEAIKNAIHKATSFEIPPTRNLF